MAENVDQIAHIIRGVLDTCGFRLYDVHFNDVTRLLRVFIDKEDGGITVDDCRNVSRLISRELDSEDVLQGTYTLEVSSPGVERALKRREHYVWAIGKLVEVDCGDKKLRGYLRRAQDANITVATDLGESTIPYASIVKAKVVEELEYGKRR
jgi:ribosome maturation factor RimP